VSTRVWYCTNCGYEVTTRGRCHSCGERLLASPLPELESGPDDDEVGYRLDMWDDDTRARLIQALISAGVLHRFEEEELVILAVDEAEVDKLVARVTGATSSLSFYDDDEEEAHEGEDASEDGRGTSKLLYEAANRLRDDPTDMQADVALAEASAAIFAVDSLPDMDDDHLAAVGRVTRRLLGALGSDEALDDEIRHQADVLCRLVAPSAGETEAQAEERRALARLEVGAKEKGRSVSLPQSNVTPGGEMGVEPLPVDSNGGGRPATLADGGGAVSAAADGAPSSSNALAAARTGPKPFDQDELTGDEPVAGKDATAPDEPTSVPQASPAHQAVPGQAADDGTADQFEDDLEEDEEDEDEGTGELVYELAEWLPEQRVELSMLLESAGVAYNWDGTDLTVAEEHEDEVDGLFEQVHGDVDEDDEARYHSIEELFGAVDRLANDPADEERRRALLEAVGVVELPTPVGVDDGYWWRVRSQGHALVAALEHGSRNDEVSREAALLAEMLHEMV
jgi:hypothetical protein